jgi:hypothetical protein
VHFVMPTFVKRGTAGRVSWLNRGSDESWVKCGLGVKD